LKSSFCTVRVGRMSARAGTRRFLGYSKRGRKLPPPLPPLSRGGAPRAPPVRLISGNSLLGQRSFFRQRHGNFQGAVDSGLAPASLEVIREAFGRLSERERCAFERKLVVPNLGSNSIASACDCHVRCLECGVVGGSEPTIRRQPRHSGVCQVAGNQFPHVVQLLFRGGVLWGVFICQ